MTSALLVLSLLAADPSIPADCSWSAVWRDMAPADDGSAAGSPPRYRKGSLVRPRPNPGERFHLEGPWVIAAVIDARGAVVDAAVVRSASTPPWPRYEGLLLKSVRKFKFDPAQRNGQPAAYCLPIVVRDKGVFDK